LQTAKDIALKTELKLRSVQSIQGRFVQIYFPSSISNPLTEKGEFYFKKPELMRWEYTEPESKTYLLKEGRFLEYIPEDNQLTKYDLSKEGYESEILSLLSGQKGILDNYFVEFSPFPSDKPKAKQLKLIPKDEVADSYILLEINQKTWLIQKAIFFDWAGNKSEFQFSHIKINIQFPQKLFELELPPNVEIIEDKSFSKKKRDQKRPAN
jgi:outer membrane lipoprotein carrier protein